MEQSLIRKNPQFDNHELVSFFFDEETGLKGIVAIHSTVLGPAVGGTRYFCYSSDEEALDIPYAVLIGEKELIYA